MEQENPDEDQGEYAVKLIKMVTWDLIWKGFKG